ncbi:MAG: hypothetical protein ABIH11_08710 [Candidatus Altiarchaeota archaeon]
MDGVRSRHISLLILILLSAKILVVLSSPFIPLEGGSAGERTLVDRLGYGFDSVFYVHISEKGYSDFTPSPHNSRFLPEGPESSNCIYSWLFLYPLMIKMVSYATNPILAGLIISNLSSITAVILFYGIALDYLDENPAFRAAILFMIYPPNLNSGMYLHNGMLSLTLVLLAWMFLKKSIIVSGLSLMLASLTRFEALIMFPLFTIIYLRGSRGITPSKRFSSLLCLNVFSLPLLYWILVSVPADTGLQLSDIEWICHGNHIGLPGLALLYSSPMGLLFTYFALLAAVRLRKYGNDLHIYSIFMMLFFLSLGGSAITGSLPRYIGSIWPLFLYYGREMDSVDVCFVSLLFVLMSSLMFNIHSNLLSIVL